MKVDLTINEIALLKHALGRAIARHWSEKKFYPQRAEKHEKMALALDAVQQKLEAL